MAASTHRARKRVVSNRSAEIVFHWDFDFNIISWDWQFDDSIVRDVFDSDWVVHPFNLCCRFLCLGSTAHFNDQIYIFFKDIFRNVWLCSQGWMFVNEINAWHIRVNKKPISRNRNISFDNKVGVFKVNSTLERFHYLDCSFSIIVGIWDDKWNFWLSIVINR